MIDRRRPDVVTLLMVLAALIILLAMGRNPICTCGAIDLWVGERDSSRTSQMIFDWYSFS